MSEPKLPWDVAGPLTPKEEELRAWSKLNRSRLEIRTAIEAAHLAVRCGFDLNDACAFFVNFRCALQDQRLENMAAYEMFRFNFTLKQVAEMRAELERKQEEAKRPKVLDLSTLWEEVMLYQTGETVSLKKGA